MIHFATRFLLGGAVGLAMMTGAAQAQFIKLGHPVAWHESGQASWYGDWHNGRRTASGEIFNQNALTAAHPSLPLGSRVRVTMAETGRSVVVTVTDRGPHYGHRIVDLSRGAAARVGLIDRGTGRVTISNVTPEEPVEVAEAPDDRAGVSPQPRGRPHTHRGGQAAAADPR
jgi:rare lipoprotein A